MKAQSLNMQWNNFIAQGTKKKKKLKTKKLELPKYDENAIMMHWSNAA